MKYFIPGINSVKFVLLTADYFIKRKGSGFYRFVLQGLTGVFSLG
jgi:hypothetical protein